MVNSKLFDILNSLSKPEFKQLGKFVRSPYFNSNKKLIKLYSYLKLHFPDFESAKITKENIYAAVFPNAIYRDTELRKLLSGMIKLSEKFLAQRSFEGSDFEVGINMSELFIEKKLIERAGSILNKIEKITDSAEMIPQDYFSSKLRIWSHRKNLETLTDKVILHELKEYNIGDFLVFYFIVFGAKIVHNFKTREFYNINLERSALIQFLSFVDFEKFNGWLKNNPSPHSEIVLMHSYLYLVRKENFNIGYYRKFKELLFKNSSKLAHAEKYNMFICLQSACRYISRTNNDFILEQHAIYLQMLSLKVYTYFEGGHMPYALFRSILNNALRLKKFEWAEEFVRDYIGTLQQKFRENLYNYSMAVINFEKGNHDSALIFAAKIEYEGFVFKNDVNLLKMKIYYDLGDFNSMEYQIDSYRHLINNNKFVGVQQKSSHSKFMTFLGEMYRIKLEGDNAEAKKLLSRIAEAGEIVSKDWLLERTEELIK